MNSTYGFHKSTMTTLSDDLNISGDLLLTPRVPQGLAAAVESLTREVLRHKPEDIYVFAANHFEKLLAIREQYSKRPSRSDKNFQTLRELNQALRMREYQKKRIRSTRDVAAQSGWSLNETAKVLERHRSIFGDSGSKISTDEIRTLANEKENQIFSLSRSRSGSRDEPDKKSKLSNKYERCSEVYPKNVQKEQQTDSCKLVTEAYSVKIDSRSTPKIISQMPNLPGSTSMLAKDIKSELRKNRISSRERKNIREKLNERRIERVDNNYERKDVTSKRTSTRRPLEKAKQFDNVDEYKEKRGNIDDLQTTDQGVKRKIGITENGFFESSVRKSSVRALSMDNVLKDYVVQKLTSTNCLEDLQSPKYVEKVQKVIDETAPIIRDKVRQLKYEIFGSMEMSLDKFEKSNNESISDLGNEFKPVYDEDIRQNDSLDDVDTLVSEPVILETKNDTLEARLTATQNILEDISSTYPKPQMVRRTSSSKDLRKGNSSSSEQSFTNGSDEVSLPEVRPASSRSSKNHSKNDANNLVLPPISPDAPKSMKKKNDFVLPVLSPSGSVSVNDKKSPDMSKDLSENSKENHHEGEETNDRQKVIENNLIIEEKEQLNLSSEEFEEEGSVHHLEQISPLKEKIIIENNMRTSDNTDKVEIANDTLQNSLQNSSDLSLENYGETKELEIERKSGDLKNKFIEIENLEKNIEKVLNSHMNDKKELRNDDNEFENSINTNDQKIKNENFENIEVTRTNNIIKNKLQELEDSEKRIEAIVNKKIDNIQRDDTEDQDYTKTNESNLLHEDATNNDHHNSVNETNTTEEVNPENNSNNSSNVNDDQNEKEKSHTNNNNNNINKIDSELDIQKNNMVIEKPGEADSNNITSNIPVSEKSTFSYILTEGSPYEIPESVTTVIIPERIVSSPESDTLEVEVDELGEVHTTLITSSRKEEEINDEADAMKNKEKEKKLITALGEYVRLDTIECSTVDIDFIRGIKSGHDLLVSHQDLDQIKEEDDKELEEITTNEQTKTAIGPLENIAEREEQEDDKVKTNMECVEVEKTDFKTSEDSNESSTEILQTLPLIDSESSDEAKETTVTDGNPEPTDYIEDSVEGEESIEARSSDSTNEVKETTITDRSLVSLSLDADRPIVPELNLDSLQDITVSSFKMTDDETEGRYSEETSAPEQLTSDEAKKSDSTELKSDEAEKDIELEIANELIELSRLDGLYSDSEEKTTDGIIETNQNNISQYDDTTDIEKPMIKKLNEIKEEPYEKLLTYVTESNDKQDENQVEVVENLESHSITNESSANLIQETISNENEIRDEIDKDETLTRSNENIDHEIFKELERALIESEKSSEILVENPIHEDLEESNPEDDNSLAVSRSASQCTTRRISSANLSRIREDDFTLDEPFQNVDVSEQSNEFTTTHSIDQIEKNKIDSDEGSNDADNETLETTNDQKDNTSTAQRLVDSNGRSTSETSSFNSAVTKIQAGVRGFLTRRRLQSGQLHSSTLDSVPSIQDSVAAEPVATVTALSPIIEDKQQPRAVPVEGSVNIRELKARQRLRREDAVQSATLSIEKAFSLNGLQHTSEFHDCLPLPIDDESMSIVSSTGFGKSNDDDRSLSVETSNDERTNNRDDRKEEDSNVSDVGGSSNDNNISQTINHEEKIPEGKENFTSSSNTGNTSDDKKSSTENVTRDEETSNPQTAETINRVEMNSPSEIGKIFIAQSNVPIVHLGLNPTVGHLVDFIMMANDESKLQNSYLNFITSIEDIDNNRVDNSESKIGNSEHEIPSIENKSDVSTENTSTREPLAITGSPRGVIIEEITSLDDVKSIPQVEDQVSELSNSPTKEDTDKQNNDRSALNDLLPVNATNDENVTNKDKSNSLSSADNERDYLENSPIPVNFSISSDKEDASSHRVPEIDEETRMQTGYFQDILPSNDDDVEKEVEVVKEVLNDSSLGATAHSIEDENSNLISSSAAGEEQRPSEQMLVESENVDNRNDEESALVDKDKLQRSMMVDSSVDNLLPSIQPDDSLNTMSFSANIDDMLGFGEESETSSNIRKTVLQVNLAPDNPSILPKFVSQDSQLGNGRTESPVTMMQIVPKTSVDVNDDSERKSKEDDDEKENEDRSKESTVEEIKEHASPKENNSSDQSSTTGSTDRTNEKPPVEKS